MQPQPKLVAFAAIPAKAIYIRCTDMRCLLDIGI